MAAISLVCPHCRNQVSFEADEGRSETACPVCKGKVQFLCARVRSKKSRGDKKAQTRDYEVRLTYADRQDFVQFQGPYEEFPMSANDWMAFGYDKRNRLSTIENVTLGRHLELARQGNPMRRAAILSAVAVVLVVLILVVVLVMHH